MGYVYVAEAGKFCKIGISDTCVEQRMKSIQTGCPVKIGRVWCSRNIPDNRECEHILHNHFQSKRSHGEWFNISFFEAAEAAEKICKNGADVEKIQSLQQENERLKKQIQQSYTRDDVVKAIIELLEKAKGG